VSFAATVLCVASQRMFIIVVYFVIDLVRKLLDTLTYALKLYVNDRRNKSGEANELRL
jgi:uncharacterized membrane protein